MAVMYGWEGNRRSGVTLAIRNRHSVVSVHLYVLKAEERDENPVYTLLYGQN